MHFVLVNYLIYIFLLCCLLLVKIQACSYSVERDVDRNLVAVRTMEFAAGTVFQNANLQLLTNLSYYPKGTFKTSLLQNNVKIGIKNQFAFIAVDNDKICSEEDVCMTIKNPIGTDGMNEKGLTISILTLEETKYENPANKEYSIPAPDLLSYALGRFENVTEFVKFLRHNITVVSCWKSSSWDDFPPLIRPFLCSRKFHMAVEDATGQSIVLEWIKGDLNVHENTVGTLTNDPPFPFHKRNLAKYASISNKIVNRANPHGQIYEILENSGVRPLDTIGLNLYGLPGDPTSSSRFIKLYYSRITALMNLGARRTIEQIMIQQQNLINSVGFIQGSVPRQNLVSHVLPVMYENPNYTILKVPIHKQFFYRTYKNMNWQKFDLKNDDLKKLKFPVHYQMEKPETGFVADDITSKIIMRSKEKDILHSAAAF